MVMFGNSSPHYFQGTGLRGEGLVVVQKVNSILLSAVPYVCTVVIGIIGWFVLQELATVRSLRESVNVLEKATAVMEGNRFTSKDGKEVWEEIYAIRTKIAELEVSIPKEVPPIWFQEKVNKIGEEVDSNGEKLGEVLEQVHSNALLMNGIRVKLDNHSAMGGIRGP